jgi:hypothetical protein
MEEGVSDLIAGGWEHCHLEEFEDSSSDLARVSYILEKHGVFSDSFGAKGLAVAANCDDELVVADFECWYSTTCGLN